MKKIVVGGFLIVVGWIFGAFKLLLGMLSNIYLIFFISVLIFIISTIYIAKKGEMNAVG